jgi:hypothetical protein
MDRERILPNLREPSQLIPIPVELIVTHVVGAQFEEPEEIPFEAADKDVQMQTAGIVDRFANKIVISQKFQREVRRYTTAHELGHWTLHPSAPYHRDRPLFGGERANISRPIVEQEADLFAAELLMPSKILRTVFENHFRAPIDGREPNATLAYVLSMGTNRTIRAIDLATKGQRYRSVMVAQTASFGKAFFVPLAVKFGVSPTAMAIQLEDLGLVQ